MKIILTLILYATFSLSAQAFEIISCGNKAKCIGDRCVMLNGKESFWFDNRTYPAGTRSKLLLSEVIIRKEIQHMPTDHSFSAAICKYSEGDHVVFFRGMTEFVSPDGVTPALAPEGEGWVAMDKDLYRCDATKNECKIKVF